MVSKSRVSAGLLMYRLVGGELQVLLVHPGGPFFRNKDEGAWSIPKGEVDPGEDPLAAPSSAVTRWRIACAPSAPLAVPGIGRARWNLILARQRGGEPFETLVEAPDAEARLALAPAALDRAAAARRAA